MGTVDARRSGTPVPDLLCLADSSSARSISDLVHLLDMLACHSLLMLPLLLLHLLLMLTRELLLQLTMAALVLFLFLSFLATRSIRGDNLHSLEGYIHASLDTVCGGPVAIGNMLPVVAEQPLQRFEIAVFAVVGNGTRTSADHAFDKALKLLMLLPAFGIGTGSTPLSVRRSDRAKQDNRHNWSLIH